MFDDPEIIVTCCITIVTSIIAVVNFFKSNKKTKTLKLAQILQKLPNIINQVEKLIGRGSGEVKRSLVLNQIQMLCLQNDIDFVEEDFIAEIEKILSTPQKKEVCIETSSN